MDIGRTGVQLDDGLFEVLVVQMPSNLIEMNSIISNLMFQKVEDCPFIYFRRAKEVTVISEAPLPWTLDGEAGGSFSYSQAEIIPNAVTFNLANLPNEKNIAAQQ
jgi:diacylglycerol kinase family enzyme